MLTLLMSPMVVALQFSLRLSLPDMHTTSLNIYPSVCVLSLGTLLLLLSDFRHFILMIFASVSFMTTKYFRRNACPSKVREMSSVVWFSYIQDAGKIFCSQQVCGSGTPTALVVKSQVPSLDMRKQLEKPIAPH